ncbi:hypothetical protein [Synechococcus sp. KORDI-52]|uniref:hypothetical protein n=1 Tax=Synechococcus sp. KORDI-52 TaxID=585425 RepID=UPI0008FFB8EA|nr:hypothetical protein [Synechococcus sp. KORDI-52]
MSKPEWRRWPWLSWCVVAATLIGCQSMVASGLHRPRLAVLLPMGQRDAEVRQDFLQGFRLGQASVEACGEPFPPVTWHGMNASDAPSWQLMPSVELKVLVAPPSADLRAFAALALERDLTVLLPYQRGQSLDTLRGLEGRERLWPIVPSQQDDLKAMVAAAMDAGWGRAMVVEDPGALESTRSNAFVELFQAAGGIVESYEAKPVQRVDPSNTRRLQRFKDDMVWSSVPTVVVADAPDGPLSQQLRAEQQQGGFGGGAPQTPNWIWLTEAEGLQDAPTVPWKQLGLQHSARGSAWSDFQEDFRDHTGTVPSLLAGAGFDTARLLALADAAPLPLADDGEINAMGWLDPEQEKVVTICEAFVQRRRGERLRLQAAASDSRFRAGQPPSGQAIAGLIE